MSSQRFNSTTLISVIAALLVGVTMGVIYQNKISRSMESVGLRSGDKINAVLNLLETKYVDQISRDSLAEIVVPEILKSLDPHSEYIPASMFEQVNEPLAGQFDGIGVMFNMLTDTVLVTNVISGGPSDKAGVVAGDRIITINDTIVAGVKLDSDKVVKKLKGKRGTKVTIGIQRNRSKELTKIDIIRGVIPIKSIDAAFIVEGNTGYIKFSRFASNTYREFMEKMIYLTDMGAKNFVIDLRGNGGGFLEQSIYIANEFLEKGEGIVYTEGFHSARREQLADGNGKYRTAPLTILIDEYSASASEIFAGAIQDNDRGTVVGRRSFGKGLVQEPFKFRDGSEARITIAHYYTPTGRSIQKPYKLGESDDYYLELYQRAKHKELFDVDSIKQDESLKFTTPKGKIVYGGGGIMPDIFVPLDTTAVSVFFRKLFTNNLIFKYSTKITEENREKINQIKSFDELNKFLNSRNIYADFLRYAAANGVSVAGAERDINKSLIIAQLKGYIGRNTALEESAYYYYLYHEDIAMIRAVDFLSGEEPRNKK